MPRGPEHDVVAWLDGQGTALRREQVDAVEGGRVSGGDIRCR